MYNYIGKKDLENGGFSFDAYWVLHGTPRGEIINAEANDPFAGYASWHTGDLKYINPWPSVPGEKFIKEEVPSNPGCFAYSFLRTGIKESTSDRSGSNYGAITIIMDNIDEERTKKFEQELKKWFEKNILSKFTVQGVTDGWNKWQDDAVNLFEGRYDKELKDSIQVLLAPYLSIQKSSDVSKTESLNLGTQRLLEEIAKLEQQKQEIERLLAEKRAQLQGL